MFPLLCSVQNQKNAGSVTNGLGCLIQLSSYPAPRNGVTYEEIMQTKSIMELFVEPGILLAVILLL